jgi:NAD(P)-dependent dehydrogenase (short-subunit alcohol dehydrogenase family)
VREAFAAIEREGRIVACIYAASDRIVRKRLQEMTEREFRTHFEANVVGAFNVLTAAARGMRKPGSALIGITSVVLYEDATPARMGAYAIAKAAQQMLLREMHRECSHEGVRVFGIAPGLMKTALTADLPDKYFEFAAARGTRLTTPEEVAQAALDCVSSKRAGGVSLDMRDNAERPL